MKSKLVKYPYKDGKRYRWDTYKMGKKFEYTWDQSEPNNFETITPYIEVEPFTNDGSKNVGYLDISAPVGAPADYGDIQYTPKLVAQTASSDYTYNVICYRSRFSRIPIIYNQTPNDLNNRLVRRQIVLRRGYAIYPIVGKRIRTYDPKIWYNPNTGLAIPREAYQATRYYGHVFGDLYQSMDIFYTITRAEYFDTGITYVFRFYSTEAAAQAQAQGNTVYRFNFDEDFTANGRDESRVSYYDKTFVSQDYVCCMDYDQQEYCYGLYSMDDMAKTIADITGVDYSDGVVRGHMIGTFDAYECSTHEYTEQFRENEEYFFHWDRTPRPINETLPDQYIWDPYQSWVEGGQMTGGYHGPGPYPMPKFPGVSYEIIWNDPHPVVGYRSPNEFFVRNKLSNFTYNSNGENLLYEYTSTNRAGMTLEEFNRLKLTNNPEAILNSLVRDGHIYGYSNGMICHWSGTDPAVIGSDYEPIKFKVKMTNNGFALYSLGTFSFTINGEDREYISNPDNYNTNWTWQYAINSPQGLLDITRMLSDTELSFNGYTLQNPKYVNFLGGFKVIGDNQVRLHQLQRMSQYFADGYPEEWFCDTQKRDRNWSYPISSALEDPFSGYFLVIADVNGLLDQSLVRSNLYWEGERFFVIKSLFGEFSGYNTDVITHNYLIDIDEWSQYDPNIASKCYIPSQAELQSIQYLLKPNVKLIGDQTANNITVPTGNTSILSYTIGDPTDKQHPNPKSLLINAPSSYDEIPFIPEPIIDGIKINPNFLGLGGPGWTNYAGADDEETKENAPNYISSGNLEGWIKYEDWNLYGQSGTGAYLLGDMVWFYGFNGSLLLNGSTAPNETWGNTYAAFSENMTPDPTIRGTDMGYDSDDVFWWKFDPNVLYKMTDYDLLYNTSNAYNTPYNNYLSCPAYDDAFIKVYKQGTNTSFYTSKTYSTLTDYMCANNGYVYISPAFGWTWMEHLTPAASTPDASKFPAGSGVQANGYMLLPDVEYTLDINYAEDLLNFYETTNEYPFINYAPKDRTWLTFNTYTREQWENGYHFQGNNWNNIGSPWAYAGYMTDPNSDHKMTLVAYEPCAPGTYINIFSITDQSDTVVTDTLGNTYSTDSQTYYDNIGSLYLFVSDVVKSNNRNAYPDDGYKGRYYYILRPQDTKFIQYTNSTKDVLNVELYKDRYTHSHSNEYFNRDTSLYNTVIGTTTSTNESSIPDASWRKYLGIYLGESIPFLGIAEHNIPDSEILGVPIYDKQVNTSETLKYGTVASASVTFVLNKPVEEAMLYNQEYLVLFYDYENNGDWKRLGFFYVDSIEAIDEYTSRLTAHDEAYKLNKYVDDFLAGYTQPDTLDGFYRDLLDYCGCAYDAHNPSINTSIGNRQLDNVYYAVKTTGTEVAHYIATLVPGFVHADIDGDMVLQQYKNTNTTIDKTQYTDLKYVAYKSDTVNKVRIALNNVVIGESSDAGENVYYISDNPLINSGWRKAEIDALAQQIKLHYTVRDYRPAEMSFLTMPNILIGDNFYVVTPKNETYCVFVMAMSVDASGVNIKSMGTQQFPVEAQSNSQFINLINNVDSVEVDVTNLELAQSTLAQRTTQNEDDIDDIQEDINGLNGDITSLRTRLTNDEANINSLDTRLSNKISNDSISETNNLISIKINGTTKNNITNKTYVDNQRDAAKSYADTQITASEAKNSISSANDLVTAMINNNTVSDIATKGYVDSQVIGGGADVRSATLTYNGNNYPIVYIGNSSYAMMMPRPSSSPYIPTYSMFVRVATMIYGCETADGEWWYLTGATVSFN